MRYVALGQTDMKVSRLGFGCIKFNELDQKTVDRALNAALDRGINFYDTARAYGPSEEMIGKAIADRRQEYYLATKTGKRNRQEAAAEVEQSLRNLQTDYIDLYQLHNVATPEDWEQVMRPSGALEALLAAKEKGQVRHVGITIHRSLENMRRAINCGIFETVMLYYNPLDEENVEDEILPLASRHGVGVIGMKALSGGSLVLPKQVKEEQGLEYDPIVRGCLRFVLGNPHIDVVIPGMRSMEEVVENVETESLPPLADKEKADLLRSIGRMNRSFKYGQRCLQCGYCQPCPRGIAIPTIFRAVFTWEQYPDSLKDLAREYATEADPGPEACTACGACRERCPAGIDIPEELKRLTSTFAILRSDSVRP